MTTTTARARTTAQLNAYILEDIPDGTLNAEWRRKRLFKSVVGSAEWEAYAEDARRGIRARYLAATTAAGSEVRDELLDLAERGELISPAELMASVPDQYGRVSPFCVYVRPAGTHREYCTRNLDLAGAVRMAQAAIGNGSHASVSVDTCG